MKNKHDIELETREVYNIGRFTIVTLKDKSGIRGVGISRLSELDKKSKNIGEKIATGRAEKAIILKKMGKKINQLFMG